MLKQDKRAVVRAFSKEYRKGRKKEKTLLLTKLSKTTGYSRKHLMEILITPPKKWRIRRCRISRYLSVLKPLKKLWAVGNYLASQPPRLTLYLFPLLKNVG